MNQCLDDLEKANTVIYYKFIVSKGMVDPSATAMFFFNPTEDKSNQYHIQTLCKTSFPCLFADLIKSGSDGSTLALDLTKPEHQKQIERGELRVHQAGGRKQNRRVWGASNAGFFGGAAGVPDGSSEGLSNDYVTPAHPAGGAGGPC